MRPVKLSWIDGAAPDAAGNLILDERLLAEGNPMIRTWETARECIVLGRSGQPERDVRLDECGRRGVPVLRRSSGGGAVLLGPGCLNYSLVLPIEVNPRWRDVRHSFDWVMDRMRQALSVPGLLCQGQSDLALDGRKVSGNAQRRTHRTILHHGTLLYDFDIARPALFLHLPQRQPRYRAGRSDPEFLGNLPLTACEIRQRLRDGWC